jgi:hypothetical protein
VLSLVQTERPRHAAPVPVKRRRRRIIVTVFTVLALAAAVAVAASLYRAKLNGGGKVNASPGIVFADAQPFTTTGDVCTANLDTNSNTVSVNFEGESPSECVIEFKLYHKGVHDLKLQNVKWSTITTESFQGPNGRGLSVSNNPAQPSSILIKFAIPEGMSEQTIATETDTGIVAVKATEFSPAGCPAAA